MAVHMLGVLILLILVIIQFVKADKVWISQLFFLSKLGVTIQWTGTLDWTTGLAYFLFLHIIWLDLLSFTS